MPLEGLQVQLLWYKIVYAMHITNYMLQNVKYISKISVSKRAE